MRRRDLLGLLGGGLALGAVGTRASAHIGPYGPLGTLDIEGAKEAVVSEDGSTVYLAVTDGFATIDASSPFQLKLLAENREVLADEENGPLGQIFDVKVEGDRLVVAGPANAQGGDVVNGFALYDVSDPANPELVGSHLTDYPIHNCFIDDGVVYLTANDEDRNPLVMVDVSDDDPEEVGRWSIIDHDEAWGEVDWFLRVTHDVWVQDGLAYIVQWDAGTWIVDVSDPASPEVVSNFRTDRLDELAGVDGAPEVQTESLMLPGNCHYVTVNDNASVLAVGEEAWDDPEIEGGKPGGIELWDISDATSPERLSRIEATPSPNPGLSGTWTTAHNFELAGERLYSAWYQGGVKLFNVSDPTNPEQIAAWRAPDRTAFWTAQLAVPNQAQEGEEGYFVASSYGVSEGIEEGLYTFADHAGEQKEPPPLSPTPSANGTEAPANGGTPTQTGTPAETTQSNDVAASGGQPGFGFAAGLAGLLGGALRVWRDRE